MQRPSRLSSSPQFSRTASTMMDTLPHFTKQPRADRRLNSTIRYDMHAPGSKFSKLKLKSEPDVEWKKWKKNGFTFNHKHFCQTLKLKIEKKAPKKQVLEPVPDSELKLRHKVRELLRLKADVDRAKENNRLIKLIEDYHQDKINGFFQHLEKYLHQHN